MKRIRVIPVLLLKEGGLIKSVGFRNYKYVGDPINAVKIFNDKEVDELALIDITASKEKRPPDIEKIKEIAGEAFMPLSYGGGITSLEQVKNILSNGVEKIIINKAAHQYPNLITEVANSFGSQSMVVSIDVKKNLFGKYKVFTDNGSTNTGLDPVEFAKHCEEKGAGEILLNSIERDGSYKGYDVGLVQKVSTVVSIPIIACGGANSVSDMKKVIDEGKASAVAAGSFFVFQRPHNAVLISYPSQSQLKSELYSSVNKI